MLIQYYIVSKISYLSWSSGQSFRAYANQEASTFRVQRIEVIENDIEILIGNAQTLGLEAFGLFADAFEHMLEFGFGGVGGQDISVIT